MKSFKKVWNILTEAYISGEVDPWNCEACFVGNLLGGSNKWSFPTTLLRIVGAAAHSPKSKNEGGWIKGINKSHIRDYKLLNGGEIAMGILYINKLGYTVDEIHELEYNFLNIIDQNTTDSHDIYETYSNAYDKSKPRILKSTHPNYENALFLAFESTMDMLKEIHRSKGEDVDNLLVFKKRQLAVA